jgi:hypothetical protein
VATHLAHGPSLHVDDRGQVEEEEDGGVSALVHQVLQRYPETPANAEAIVDKAAAHNAPHATVLHHRDRGEAEEERVRRACERSVRPLDRGVSALVQT